MRSIVLLCLLVAAACSTRGPAPLPRTPAADLLLTGGKVFTADSTRPWAEALAIRGERIVAVGSSAEVERLAGPATRRIDLGGRVVIPGIHDAHNHLALGAPIPHSFRIAGNPIAGPGRAQMLDSLASRVERAPAGAWIGGWWGLALRNDPTFRRAALDSVAPDHPVVLMSPWGHGMLLNTRALRLLGIAEAEPDPLGGWYERGPGGALTGLLDEYAQVRPWHAYYASAPGALVADLRAYAGSALRLGVTSVQHMSSTPDARTTERVFREAALPLRVRIVPFPATDARGRRLAEWTAVDPRPAPLTTVSGVKYLVDGSPLEQLALMRRPYPGRPGWHGRLNLPEDTLRRILREALGSDRQLMLHVVGDSAAAVVLSLMEELAPDSAWRGRRVRFEHANGITGAQVARARRLGIVVAQPRAETSPLRTWLDGGIPVAYGSDTAPNPFVDLASATTKPGNPGEAISREEAMRLYTRGAAYAELSEREKGTLAPGMLADLAVLSQDVFTVPAEALPATVSLLTLVGGRTAYDSGALTVVARP